MKISGIRKILKEDLTGNGDLPGWIDQFLYYINLNNTTIGQALAGNLTFTDNFLCKTLQQILAHNVETLIAVDKTLKVFGVIPVLATNSNDPVVASQNMITGFKANLKGNGTLGVTVTFAGGLAVKATVTLIVLYQ